MSEPAVPPTPKESPAKENTFVKLLREFLQVCSKFIEILGWPGFLVLLSFFFLQYNGSEAQKREVIDLYFLGKDLPQHIPFIFAGVVFLTLVVAQHVYWKRRVRLQDSELQRLGQAKSDRQQKQIDHKLNHSKRKQRR